jgi:peptidoglycan hydrolase CwlO-like protein
MTEAIWAAVPIILTGILAFIIKWRKQDEIEDQNLIKSIYQELGRLQNRVDYLEKERDALSQKLMDMQQKYAEVIAENKLLREKIEHLENQNSGGEMK